jgi:hypothetical protein
MLNLLKSIPWEDFGRAWTALDGEVVPGGGIEPPTRGFSRIIYAFSHQNIDKRKILIYQVFFSMILNIDNHCSTPKRVLFESL